MRAEIRRAVGSLPARLTAAGAIALTAAVLALGVLATTASRTSSGSSTDSGRPESVGHPVPTLGATPTAHPTTTHVVSGSDDHTVFTVLVLLFAVALSLVALSFVAILAVIAYRLMLGAIGAGRVDLLRETTGRLDLDRPEPDQTRTDRQRARRRALERTTVRGAIVACWADLEDAAAQVGHPRADFETSRELVSRLRGVPGVDPAALETLRTLFTEARFSEHDLPERCRERAIRAVEQLEDDLRAAPGRAERETAR
ncbi:MAG: DUF4129 domain-containing protein [Nostocoides sp.]